jgi:hypothetical protein
MEIKQRVKYVLVPCGLTHLFFAPCCSFCIADSTLVLAKDGNGTSVQKLMVVHVNTSKVLTRVLCIRKKKALKLKKNIKKLKT